METPDPYLTRHEVADEPDMWMCRHCERVFIDDTKVENHTTCEGVICHECLAEWREENPDQ